MARFSESIHLHLDHVSNIKVLLQLLHRLWIKNYPRDSNVETTVNSNFLVVLNEGLDDHAQLQIVSFLYVLVDEGILLTLGGLSDNLLVDVHLGVIKLPVLIKLVNQLLLQI